MERAARALVPVVVVLLASAPATGETVLFVPAAAHAPGAAGSVWTTELSLLNPSRSTGTTVRVRFLPRPGLTTPAEVPVSLGPRAGTVVADVVAAAGASGGGALRLAADGPFVASSRTLNTGSAACGAFGVGVPAVPASSAVTRGVFPPLPASRLNVGLVNPDETRRASATLRLREPRSPDVVFEVAVEVPPLASVQLDDVVSRLVPGRQGSDPVVLELASDVAVLAWATPIDGTSGDAAFVLAASDPDAPGSALWWEPWFTVRPGEGLAWRVEEGLRMAGGAGVPRVIVLPDGRLRLFSPSPGGMRSATSADGLTFVPDAGTRGPMTDPAVIYLQAGGWRFLWPEGPPGSQSLRSAVSTDGLAFTVEGGDRFRPGPQDAGFVQVPHAVRLPDGRWRLYYVADWYGTGGAPNQNNTRTAVSADEGLTWVLEAGGEATGRDSVDPDVVRLEGGAYRLYYKHHDAFRTADSEGGASFPNSGGAGRQVLVARDRFDPTVVKRPDGTLRMYFGTTGGVASAVATDTN